MHWQIPNIKRKDVIGCKTHDDILIERLSLWLFRYKSVSNVAFVRLCLRRDRKDVLCSGLRLKTRNSKILNFFTWHCFHQALNQMKCWEFSSYQWQRGASGFYTFLSTSSTSEKTSLLVFGRKFTLQTSTSFLMSFSIKILKTILQIEICRK